MKDKVVKYTENPDLPDLKYLVVVPDFLPSPEEIAKAGQIEKVTIGLSGDSLDFFRTQATKYKTSYQRMIRKLLDEYVQQFKKKLA